MASHHVWHLVNSMTISDTSSMIFMVDYASHVLPVHGCSNVHFWLVVRQAVAATHQCFTCKALVKKTLAFVLGLNKNCRMGRVLTSADVKYISVKSDGVLYI